MWEDDFLKIKLIILLILNSSLKYSQLKHYADIINYEELTFPCSINVAFAGKKKKKRHKIQQNLNKPPQKVALTPIKQSNLQ